MASDQDENVALEEVRCVVPSWSLSRRAHSTLTRCPVQRLKSALWLAIGKIVDEETIKLGVNATPQFIGALTEMVWAQIGTYSVHINAPVDHASNVLSCYCYCVPGADRGYCVRGCSSVTKLTRDHCRDCEPGSRGLCQVRIT